MTMTYPWPDEGTPLDAISTPMPVIDEDRLAANIARAQSYLDGHGKAFRPHIKTHKIPAVAKQQLQAGAIGINCQKVSEAEVFADAGFDDILITYNILGAAKLSRLRALNARIGLTERRCRQRRDDCRPCRHIRCGKTAFRSCRMRYWRKTLRCADP